MEQCPSWLAKFSLDVQVIPHILWYLKADYYVHTNPPHVPTLGQMNPGHTITHYIFTIYFNIIDPFKSCTPGGILPSGFPTTTLNAPLLFTIKVTHPAHLILLNLLKPSGFFTYHKV